MTRRTARRSAAIVAVFAVALLGLGFLVRASTAPDDARRAAAVPVTEATASAPVPPVTASRGSVPTPSAVSTLLPAAPAAAASRAAAQRLPGFPALTGALVSGGSPLHDVRQDQGISVPLPDGRSLWIFADTTQASAPFFFVTSSAAVSPHGSKQLTYAATGKHLPVEFLPRTAAERADGVSGSYYTAVWPTGATRLPDGRILISYARYRVSMTATSYTLLGAGLYSFRYDGLASFRKGAHATRIADDLWTAAEGAIGSPVYSGGYVYFANCENLQCYSVRTTPSGLTSHASYRWWTGSGWSAARTARAPMAYGASKPGLNPSMAYLPGFGVYATAGTAAGHVAGTGLLWVAPHPWGPWSSPASFRLPNCPAAGCYTLNLHPGESIGGRVRVSYATSGVGPYVRVTDIPIRVTPSASSVRSP